MQYQLHLVDFSYKEISLKIYVPDALQVQQYYEAAKNNIMFPYWSKIWPAAFALSQFLIDNRHYIINKKVEEFAAGLALPSLVAASFAATVNFSDHSNEAINIAMLSVANNNLKNISGKVINWKQHQHHTDADVVLVSDLNYEPQDFDALYNFILSLVKANITIILSTPQRLFAKPFVEKLLPYAIQNETMEIKENIMSNAISVLVLQLKQ